MIIFDMVTGQYQDLDKKPDNAGMASPSTRSHPQDQLQTGLQEILVQPDCQTDVRHKNAVIISQLQDILKDTD